MSRSHPPTLLTLAERALREEGLLARGDRVLCACSGGPDSTALLHVLARLRTALGYEVIAHGVDHGLRAEAAAELAMVADLASRIGVPFAVTRVDVAPGSNLQARARSVRYGVLEAAAASAGANRIATGHNADDRAETFLLRLLRGAGPRGLAVLPPRASSGSGGPDRIRPLLRARRTDILAHLGRHGLGFAEDPSNRDPRFARVRVRRELIPLLEGLSPKIVEHLAALADMLAHENTAQFPELGRAQRLAIDRARLLGRAGLRIRARGGRDIDVTIARGDAVVKVVHDLEPSGLVLPARDPKVQRSNGRCKT